MRANSEVRDLISFHRLKNWEVANEIGVSDSRFSVWLRTELNEERKKRTLEAIARLTSK